VKRTVAKGGADIMISLRGRFCCMEVKTPKSYKAFFKNPGAHEQRQAIFLEDMAFTGALVAVVCSLEQAQEFFKAWSELGPVSR